MRLGDLNKETIEAVGVTSLNGFSKMTVKETDQSILHVSNYASANKLHKKVIPTASQEGTESIRLIRLREYLMLLGISKSTYYDWANPRSLRFKPAMPKPIRLGKTICWRLHTVKQFIEDIENAGV